jgi:hypothetical protein
MSIAMRENYSLSAFKDDIKLINRDIGKGLVPVDLGTKNGISLAVLKTGKYARNPNFILSKDKEIVGLLSLEAAYAEVTDIADYEVHAVYLKEEFRGQNLGVVLYLAAIHVLHSICSSENIGIAAVKTWKAIAKYHEVDLVVWENKAGEAGSFVAIPYAWDSRGVPTVKGVPIDKGVNKPRSFTFRVKA